MIFETHLLQAPLDKFIEAIFYYKNFRPEHSIERVVPTGHLFLLFELDGIERNTFDNESLQANASFKNVWISGMHKNYLSISVHNDSEMLVVQFKPYGAFPFLQLPIHQLNDRVIPAQEIFGDEIFSVRKKIVELESPQDKFGLMNNWLTKKIDQQKNPTDELIDTVNQFATNPMSDHKTIVRKYSKTQKHLIDQFKKYCGLTPKVLHRIFRFNSMLQQLHQQKKIEWSQIAYQFGYADQSHFIKEFKEFSGFNPQDFIIADYHNDEPNFFPLEKKNK